MGDRPAAPAARAWLAGTAAGAGAVARRRGLFREANGGTLFLDEVGELPLDMQVKLLRALQERAVRPVGGETEVAVNVRVISATHRDLSQLLATGSFRQDLYYRLNVIEVRTPSLRERRDDIPLLANAILARLARTNGLDAPPVLDPAALARLREHAFPGNVRELENVLERAVILADEGQALERSQLFAARASRGSRDLMELGGDGELVPTAGDADHDDLGREHRLVDEFAARLIDNPAVSLPDAQDRVILAAWHKAGRNVSAAAKLLGLSRAQLDYRLKKLQTGTTPSKASANRNKRTTTTRRTKT